MTAPALKLDHAPYPNGGGQPCQVSGCRTPASLMPWDIGLSATFDVATVDVPVLSLYLCTVHGKLIADAFGEIEILASADEDDDGASPCSAEDLTDDEAADKWRGYGRLYGYPECCIENWIDLRLHRGGVSPPGTLKWAAGLREDPETGELEPHGFVPCPEHWEHPLAGYVRRLDETERSA